MVAAIIYLIIVSLSCVGITRHLEKNLAWAEMSENIAVALDIDHQNYWKNRNTYPQAPINSCGTLVDASTYERVAWFRAGISLLHENPLGYGLLHHSFKALATMKWPNFINQSAACWAPPIALGWILRWALDFQRYCWCLYRYFPHGIAPCIMKAYGLRMHPGAFRFLPLHTSRLRPMKCMTQKFYFL